MKNSQDTYEQVKYLIASAVEQGKDFITLSYKFFKNDNALLKYVLEKGMEDGFVFKLYETQMEIHLTE